MLKFKNFLSKFAICSCFIIGTSVVTNISQNTFANAELSIDELKLMIETFVTEGSKVVASDKNKKVSGKIVNRDIVFEFSIEDKLAQLVQN